MAGAHWHNVLAAGDCVQSPRARAVHVPGEPHPPRDRSPRGVGLSDVIAPGADFGRITPKSGENPRIFLNVSAINRGPWCLFCTSTG